MSSAPKVCSLSSSEHNFFAHQISGLETDDYGDQFAYPRIDAHLASSADNSCRDRKTSQCGQYEQQLLAPPAFALPDDGVGEHCTAGKQPVRCNSPQIAERRSCNRGRAEMEHRYEETHIDCQGARAGDNISKVDRVTRHRQQDWSHDVRLPW